MWPYWLIFFIPACLVTTQMRPLPNNTHIAARWGTAWSFMFVFLVLMIGLRHEVGGDWLNYLREVDHAVEDTWVEAVTKDEVSYSVLNWLGAHGWGGTYFVNTVCACLFAWGLIAFCQIQPRPWLAMVVAVPYLITVVAMGYTRQGVAVGLIMLGLVGLHQGRVLKFLLWVAFAATFHKSAVVLVSIALFAKSNNRWLVMLGVMVSSGILYTLLLKESVNSLMINYVEAEVASSGAGIRIAMNALPAMIFLLFRRKFVFLTTEQRSFWLWMSFAALGFVVLLWVSPSSTAVDRVALYWIPLQLSIWSQVPDAFGTPMQRNAHWVYAVVAYSAVVLFVWLFFATYSWAWLPYKFYPWEALWQ
jgi:hypothetical protein